MLLAESPPLREMQKHRRPLGRRLLFVPNERLAGTAGDARIRVIAALAPAPLRVPLSHGCECGSLPLPLCIGVKSVEVV